MAFQCRLRTPLLEGSGVFSFPCLSKAGWSLEGCVDLGAGYIYGRCLPYGGWIVIISTSPYISWLVVSNHVFSWILSQNICNFLVMGHPNTGFVGSCPWSKGPWIHMVSKPWLVDLGANSVLNQPRPDGSWLTWPRSAERGFSQDCLGLPKVGVSSNNTTNYIVPLFSNQDFNASTC